MKDNLQAFNDEGIDVPVILGGAALTPKFVNQDCSSVYSGKVIYGKDAFTDLKFMDAFVAARNNGRWDNNSGFLDGTPQGLSIGNSNKNDNIPKPKNNNPQQIEKTNNHSDKNKKNEPQFNHDKPIASRSEFVQHEKIIIPPFVGSKIMNGEEINIDDLLFYLDRQALFAGQWQMRRARDQSKEDYASFLDEKAEPVLENLIIKVKNEGLLDPAIAYGYFPCASNGNSITVFDVEGRKVLGKFDLPRQRAGKRYCIADFYHTLVEGNPVDFLPMQAVTMGNIASEYSQKLFKSDAYSDYLFFHGFAVQMAEALAEWTHAKIRTECGFSAEEPKHLKDILAQRYRGSRYSFGYPACPNVADSRQQLEWLEAERIGLSMDSGDQLHPEQSTTALVALHSKALYFSA